MTPWYKDPIWLSGGALLIALVDAWWFQGPLELLFGTAVIYLGCCITANKETTITITIEEKEKI